MNDWSPIEAEGGMRHANGPAAVRAGDFVFLSSVKGVDPETQESSRDPEVQLRQAVANIDVVLRAANLGLADIVKITVFLEDLDRNRAHLDEIWGETFANGTPPARATIAVEKVGGKADTSIALFDVIAYGPR